MDHPDLIIFDLGDVLVHVDMLTVAAKLGGLSEELEYHNPANFIADIKVRSAALLADFDTGKISSQRFFEEVASSYRLKLSFDEFVAIWNSGFRENPEVSLLIHRLADRCRLFLLSNTNPLHFEYLESVCSVFKKMEALIVSYRVGFQKPALEIYRHALETAGLAPDRVWYVDDIPEFVAAAADLGIHSIQFQSASQLEGELTSILE